MNPFVYIVVGITTTTKESDIFAVFSSEEKANTFKESLERSDEEVIRVFHCDPVKYEVRKYTLN